MKSSTPWGMSLWLVEHPAPLRFLGLHPHSLGTLLLIFFFPDRPYPVLVLSNPASWNGLFKTEISILLCQFSPFPCPIIYGIKVTLFPFDARQGFAWPGFCLLLEMFFLFFLILRRKFSLILKDKSLKKTILVPIVHYSFFLLELHLVIKTYCQ